MDQSKHLKKDEKILHFAKLSSTNSLAKQFLGKGQALPFWVLADEQTQGRGRMGRDWVSVKGNLFTTTVRRVRAQPDKLPVLSLLTGVALYEAIDEIANGSVSLSLKWPNDILSNHAKLGGILIETQPTGSVDQTDLIIGIGVNITSNPALENKDTVCLASLGVSSSRDQLFEALAVHFNAWLERWDHGDNNVDIIDAWLKKAHRVGTPLTIQSGPKQIRGSFMGLNEQGALLLKLDNDEIKTITGGELV